MADWASVCAPFVPPAPFPSITAPRPPCCNGRGSLLCGVPVFLVLRGCPFSACIMCSNPPVLLRTPLTVFFSLSGAFVPICESYLPPSPAARLLSTSRPFAATVFGGWLPPFPSSFDVSHSLSPSDLFEFTDASGSILWCRLVHAALIFFPFPPVRLPPVFISSRRFRVLGPLCLGPR